MNLSQKSLPISVSVLGATEEMKKTLQNFFQEHCTIPCELVDDDSAVVSIIDLDSSQGQQHLQQYRVKHVDKTLIVLSIHDTEIEGAILLRKPLKPKDLVSAVEKAYTKNKTSGSLFNNIHIDRRPANTADKSEPGPLTSANSLSHRVYKKANTESKKSFFSELIAELKTTDKSAKNRHSQVETFKDESKLSQHEIDTYVGSAADIDPHNAVQLANAQYNPEDYFQGYLSQAGIKAVKYQRAVKLDMPHGSVVVLPDAKTVLVDIIETRLHSFCILPVDYNTLSRSFLDESEVERYRRQTIATELEPLLWKTAQWASKGRVPIETSLTLPVVIGRRFNISRLLVLPHAVQIASLWSEKPLSILDTAKALGIPQRYVFSFYSASFALGMAVVRQGNGAYSSEAVPGKNNRRRNLFGRILNQLSINQ